MRLDVPLKPSGGQHAAPACCPIAHPAPPSLRPRSFAYVMMQRWLDAGKCFNFILGYISK